MRNQAFTGITLAACLAAGCATTRDARNGASATPPNEARRSTSQACPMRIAGTSVTAGDVAGGASLAFRTRGDVEGLRQQVRRLAARQHNRARLLMVAQRDRAAPGFSGASGSQRAVMPAATTSVTYIPGGARLDLWPTHPAELQALREHARLRVGQMATGSCASFVRRSPVGPAQRRNGAGAERTASRQLNRPFPGAR